MLTIVKQQNNHLLWPSAKAVNVRASVIPRLNTAAGQRFSQSSFPEGQRHNQLSATGTSFAKPTGKQKTLPKQREKVLTFSICPFREGKTEVLGKGWGSGWFKNLNSPLRDSAGFSPVFTLGFAFFMMQ